MINHNKHMKGLRGSTSSLSDAQWEWVYDRFQEGYYLKEIAALIDRNPRTVIYQFRRRGYRMPNELPLLETRRAEFEALAE